MEKNLILEQLVHDVNTAEQKFQMAEGGSINLAIYELMCAEERLNIYLIKKKKNLKERCNNGNFDIKEMQSDHIVPWSKGGKTTPANLQIDECNNTKSDR